MPVAVISIALGVVACGSDSNTAGTPTATAYSGPGSKWDISLSSDNTFSVTHRNTVSDPIDMTVTGSYARQSNGIVKLTVRSAVDGAGSALSSPASGDSELALVKLASWK